MGFLDSLRQAVSVGPGVRGRGGIERLHLRVLRLFEEGRFREATEAARRLLDAQRAAVGEDHPDYATTLSNLALLLQRQGDLDGAEPLLRQALDARQRAVGESHPDYATSLNNLGELLFLRERLEDAEPLLRRALEVRKESLGETHPDYAVSLNSLALLLNRRGDLAAAEALLSQALDIRREALGETHPDYATGLSNLALLHFDRGDAARAEPLLRQALEIRRAALGDRHPDTVATLSNLGRLLGRRAGSSGADQPGLTARAPGEGAIDYGASDDLESGAEASPSRPPGDGAADSSMDREGNDEIARLKSRLHDVGERLRAAGRTMQADGRFPDADLLHALADCHHRLSTLRVEARRRAESAGVPSPPPERLEGLREIGALLDAVARAETSASRSAAVGVLDRVLGLRTRDGADHPGLLACQAKARELRGIITDSSAAEVLPVVDQLASGDHPFASLVALVEDAAAESRRGRAAPRRAVAWAFGRPLAAIAARGRLGTDPAHGSPQPPVAFVATPEGKALVIDYGPGR
jgi:tetratricopeptide (TPR) repeat protein